MSQLNRWLNPRSSAAQMALLFLACTVLAYAAPSAVLRWVVLEPDAVLQEAELWRPVSFLFVSSPTAFAVLFNILIIVSIGGRLRRCGVAGASGSSRSASAPRRRCSRCSCRSCFVRSAASPSWAIR